MTDIKPQVPPKSDTAEIKRALAILTSSDEVRELRSPKTGQGTISGYFSDSKKLAQAAANLSGNVPAVYITINPVNPALQARSDNKVKPRVDITTSDGDVAKRSWLPVDLDAKRPAWPPATGQWAYRPSRTLPGVAPTLRQGA